MQPNGIVSLDIIGWAERPVVKAFIVGGFAVHKCRRGDNFGVGEHWDITFVKTGAVVSFASITRRKDAIRIAKLFDRCDDGSPLEKNPRAIRLARRVERWWRFDQGTSRENRVRARRKPN